MLLALSLAQCIADDWGRRSGGFRFPLSQQRTNGWEERAASISNILI